MTRFNHAEKSSIAKAVGFETQEALVEAVEAGLKKLDAKNFDALTEDELVAFWTNVAFGLPDSRLGLQIATLLAGTTPCEFFGTKIEEGFSSSQIAELLYEHADIKDLYATLDPCQ